MRCKDNKWVKRAQAALAGMACALMTVSPGLAQANVNIANVPLFLTTSVDPNIMFILDDSGSMHWEIMPDQHISNAAYYVYGRIDNLYSSGNYTDRAPTFADDPYNAFARSPVGNTVYYDPGVTYSPWPRADGSGSMPNANPSAALHNPMRPARGSRNLTANNTRNGSWRRCSTITRDVSGTFNFSGCATFTATQTFWPAVYYWHDGSDGYDFSNYERVEIRSDTPFYTDHGRENRTDCASAATATCTYDEEIQNFANWYTYYRSRILAARGGIGLAFAGQPENMRVGYGTINAGSSSVDAVTTEKIVRGVRAFSGADRQAFFDLLYDRDIPAAGTPLRRSLEAAGEYFRRSDSRGPWSTTPGLSGGEDLSCRQSFAILMTDGYWNGPNPSDAIGNADNSSGPLHVNPNGDNFQYVPSDPFRDGVSRTLADVAMYYWKNDLRPDMDNNVPSNARNPAFWQHMVTYGIGLGVTGSVDPDDAWQAVTDGTAINWPDPYNSHPAKIDDLLHAGVNSRGGFFSAQNPVAFANELAQVLEDIIGRVEDSATSAAASAAVIQADTLLYLAGFRSGDWTGELKAFQIMGDGSVGALAWDAEARLAAMTPSERNLYTANSATGNAVSFDFAQLSPAQQAALNRATDDSLDGRGDDRIDWLRGESVTEFRSRTTPLGERRLLGDIVHSSPQFVGRPNLGYSLLPGAEGSAYSTFRSSSPYSSRPSAIYVGANDGLLHAFHGTTGGELFAYMPSELLLPETGHQHARINRLMDPDYAHRYFVDGAATIGDVYVGGSWKTVLIGTMGAGGRTVFALDVTDPTNFDESKVLWEFTHPGLGYGVTNPSIVRMRNGQWAAVFGNGYNSANHTAGLFIVPIGNPSSYVFVDTGVGNSTTPNGLAPVVVTDAPSGDLNARLVYAGDLQGRMWRFDVSSTNPNQWNDAGNRSVLFQARDASDVPQPITARAQVTAHPTEQGTLMVLFGTGSYFRTQDGDLTAPQVQSLYGLKDQNGAAISSRNDLVEQEIVWQGDQTFTTSDGDVTYTLRQVSEETVTTADKGWYLDLVYEGNNQGERVISEPTFPSGPVGERVRFATMIPDEDPCGTGRRGFLMDIMLATGGAVPYTVFDLDQDGVFDSGDYVNNLPVSGVGFGGGEKPTTVLNPDTGIDHIFGGQGDDLRGLPGGQASGRQSWRQLR